MVNSMQRSNSLQQQQNTKSTSMQSCSSSGGMSTDATNAAGNTQTANQSIASVRNRTCTESTNTSPHKEIKASSGSLDVSSPHSSRDIQGRPRKQINENRRCIHNHRQDSKRTITSIYCFIFQTLLKVFEDVVGLQKLV